MVAQTALPVAEDWLSMLITALRKMRCPLQTSIFSLHSDTLASAYYLETLDTERYRAFRRTLNGT
jgi:hypothetical protein